ncbi:hypothetical protein OG709_25120 [Streptomyces sp. NBC_01267]|uniref:hypothetical protein n=1 Tax=unclassified Streptomyces TaxID=2593676 RepID=UPI002DDC50A0|nr:MULTISPECIES: hypothetical protein [unclassified Streptomyces]WSC19845.1 hypothetical protein OIE60_09190 [Streptomyces sp. NBC_01766]
MDQDLWAVLPDVERNQWEYVPGQALGPLRFGMSWKDCAEAMAGHGFADVSEVSEAGWCVAVFCGPEPLQAAVKCYFDRGGVLGYVLVDGRTGPQVTCEGIRLIGRVPSELGQEMEAHAAKYGIGIRFSYGGDVCCDGFEMEPGTQRAGDTVVTWALFFSAGDDHSNARDGAPAGIWRHW